MPLARVTITLPRELAAAADRAAAEAQRSRSWLIAEALRRFLSGESGARSIVREPPAVYQIGLGPARQTQLQADLALTPEERVRAAEATAKLSPRRSVQRSRVIAFDRLEDFFEWERRDAIGL